MSEVVLDRPGVSHESLALRADLVARARDLVPLLARNAAATDEGRRVVEENIAAVEEAGLYRIHQPRRFGGHQADFRTLLEVSRELGRGCGSTSWAVTLNVVGSWILGSMPDRAQEEVWGADPRARLAGSLMPAGEVTRVDGGYRITGEWGWASGCLHAQWGQVGIPLVDEQGEIVGAGYATIPMSELAIKDTWYVTGMRGSGSNTLVAQNVFVPDHRVLSYTDALQGRSGSEHADETLYQTPFAPGVAVVLVGPMVGMAQGALELVLEKAPKRAVSYTWYQTQVDSPSFQFAVARAAMLIDSAYLHGCRATADVDAAAQSGELPSFLQRARVRADVGWVMEQTREAVRLLVSAHGASALAEANPLQRIMRDVETASRHAAASPGLCNELYGRALVGLTEGFTPFA